MSESTASTENPDEISPDVKIEDVGPGVFSSPGVSRNREAPEPELSTPDENVPFVAGENVPLDSGMTGPV